MYFPPPLLLKWLCAKCKYQQPDKDRGENVKCSFKTIQKQIKGLAKNINNKRVRMLSMIQHLATSSVD